VIKPRAALRRAIAHERFGTHNLKVTDSNPVPATNKTRLGQRLSGFLCLRFRALFPFGSTLEARGRAPARAGAYWSGHLLAPFCVD
jgi:hypothetical protein